MDLLSLLFGRNAKAPKSQHILVDLAGFTCGGSRLGEPVNRADYFADALRKRDVFKDETNGIEVGTAKGVFDYLFVEMGRFQGQFSRGGSALVINVNTTEGDVLSLFGQPYWTDRSDGEVIMFYEYQRGDVELQFEFPSGDGLGFITLARNGVLSTEDQRIACGVTKPWPP